MWLRKQTPKPSWNNYPDAHFPQSVFRAAQLLLYIPEERVVQTLANSALTPELAYLATKAGELMLRYELDLRSVGDT